MRGEALTRAERVGLIVLTAVSAATHSATLAVLLALMVAAALLFLFDRDRVPARALLRGADRARARRRAGARRRLHRGQTAGLDAGRLCAVVRPHAARRHRQEISRRALPRSEAATVRLQGPAARRRRRLVLGQPAVRQARPLCRPRSGDGKNRGRQPDRLSGPASRDRAHRHRPATGRRAHRRRRAQPRSGTPTASSSATRRNWRPPCTRRASRTARSPSPPSTGCIIPSRCCRWRCCR